ncbi:SAM-dependent methyltransferase [Aneurinibacillus sp. Ricciae_BoGa-3]|uniref:class I SAM-dependent methyltransferase n=1 Tax=Aneurinibacillus sp. Ricciae_BoGa-3 TaxID=3022697 RepID=UPI0023409C7E|nr:SAM-dependent methyltransferase [Aneurinibacillus sp. Ricciae_BoGa-3]WCK53106.1 SAM-dependent methyltransferase [Aneurinibacillus sp. Ricciae_BoGa-3]
MGRSALEEEIVRAIASSPEGYITFRDFMAKALYDKDGYYQKEQPKVGKQGDFYTSSSVHPIFGAMLAQTLGRMVDSMAGEEPRRIVEMGGGTGRLTQHILQAFISEGRDLSGVEYFMIEASDYHRRIQQKNLAAFSDAVEIHWFSSLAEVKQRIPQLTGVLFSNELPDSFPVHLVQRNKGSWHEIGVSYQDGSFIERLVPVSSPLLLEYCQHEKIPLADGYRAEVNLESIKWMREAAEWISDGFCMTIDYGYTRDILYDPSRREGTLLCYRDHKISSNPYEFVGEKDITSHVNFSALMDAGERSGLATLYYATQREFLLKEGILNRLQEHQGGDPFRNEAARLNRAILQLISPGGMGDTFRVLIQGKNVSSSTI